MQTAVAAIVLLGGLAAAANNCNYKVEDEDGRAEFKDIGEIYPNGAFEDIRIDLDINEIDVGIDKMINLTQKEENKEEWDVKTWHIKYQKLQSRYDTGLAILGEDDMDDRSKRFLGEFLGVYNFIEGRERDGAIKANTDAIEFNTKSIDNLAHHAEIQDSAIHNVSKHLEKLDFYERKADMNRYLKSTYYVFEDHLDAVVDVAQGAFQHRLHPSVIKVLNITRVWREAKENMKEKGLVPVYDDVRYLFQLPMSIKVQGSLITMTLHCPAVEESTEPWRMLTWQPRPWLREGRLHTILHDDEVILRHPKEARHAVITRKEKDEMVRVGDSYFWMKGMVVYTNPATCIGAMWIGDDKKVSELCPVSSKPVKAAAWALNDEEFRTVATEELRATITCGSTCSEIVRLQGMQKSRPEKTSRKGRANITFMKICGK